MDAVSYELPENYVVRSEKGQALCPFRLAVVLQRLIDSDGLTIDEYLPLMNAEPFFLVAATGLGKTVVVPPHVWLRQCAALRESYPEVLPRVWVVEPRVMIADEQGAYMHQVFSRLHRSGGLEGDAGVLFGSISSGERVRQDAPILFITTGIFTLKARAGDFDSRLDRIIIDEAHETIAQNPDVELAVAICRQAGVPVDYMSATVDTESISYLLGIKPQNIILANKKRYPIYISNVGLSMQDSIVDIVRELLIERQQHSKFLPPPDYPIRHQIIKDLFDGEERSHGLLVAINSVSGANSDAKIVQKKLEEANLNVGGRGLDVLELSSKQTKNPAEMARFDARLTAIEQEHRPYVVVATSVIEMGVTIGTLDFVVTMDSGFTNVVVGDRTVPAVVPLPFNSLKQRLGRVGRRRAGVGLITTEVGAAYTNFDLARLNSEDLEYEPVRTPLATASLLQLAYFTYEQGWRTPNEIGKGLVELRLPSRREVITVHRLIDLVEERRFLQRLGVAGRDGRLTSVGRSIGPWLGDGYLPYAMRLQRSLSSMTPDPLQVFFWVIALAASDTTLSGLMKKRVLLDQMRGAPTTGGFSASDLDASNELVGLFQLGCAFGSTYGSYIDEQHSPLRSLHTAALSSLDRDCEALGMDRSRMLGFLDRIQNVIVRLTKINRSNGIDLRSILGTMNPTNLGDVTWPTYGTEDVRFLSDVVDELPGRVALELELEERRGGAEIVQYWRLDGRRIARAGDATPRLSAEEAQTWRFTGRLQLLREATFDGLWLDVTHYALARS